MKEWSDIFLVEWTIPGVENGIKGAGIDGFEFHSLGKLLDGISVGVKALGCLCEERLATRAGVAGRLAALGRCNGDDASARLKHANQYQPPISLVMHRMCTFPVRRGWHKGA
jgi:hypothetical protein